MMCFFVVVRNDITSEFSVTAMTRNIELHNGISPHIPVSSHTINSVINTSREESVCVRFAISRADDREKPNEHGDLVVWSRTVLIRFSGTLFRSCSFSSLISFLFYFFLFFVFIFCVVDFSCGFKQTLYWII